MFGKQMSAELCSDIGMQKSSVLCFSIAVGHPATGPPPSELFFFFGHAESSLLQVGFL